MRYDGLGYPDVPSALAVSPDGSLVVVTGISDTTDHPHAPRPDFATVAYSSDGTHLWTARYDAGEYDRARDVTISRDGSTIYVTGDSWGGETRQDALTIAYAAATGSPRWIARFDDGPQEYGRRVALSPHGGTVFVLGSHLIAYDSRTGDMRWARRAAGMAIAVAPDGSAVYAGGGRTEFLLDAYAPHNGRRLWSARYDHPPTLSDEVREMALSRDGEAIYMVARSRIPWEEEYVVDDDYTTVRFSSSNGRMMWVAQQSDLERNSEEPLAVAVSDAGTVIVVGRGPTVAYDAETGDERWRVASERGLGEVVSVAIHPDGSAAYLLGRTSNGGSDWGMLVASLSLATGVERWRGTYRSLQWDHPRELALNGDGSTLFVTGSTEDQSFYADFVTMAFPSGGTCDDGLSEQGIVSGAIHDQVEPAAKEPVRQAAHDVACEVAEHDT